MTESIDPLFDPTNGICTREQLLLFSKSLFLKGYPQTPDELDLTLDTYYRYALYILNNSPLREGLNTCDEKNSEFFARLTDNQDSSEWWAAWLIKTIISLKYLINNTEGEEKIREALWEMNKLTNIHSMLTFTECLEPTTWSGYTIINNLKQILKIWEVNKDNANEEFWQQVFWNNSIILSQVFSFPIIYIGEKVYVGGKNLNNKKGNLVDFLVGNNLTKNTALIEIKTPKTKIIGSKYRLSVYSISADITGSIVQISNYKDSLIKNYHSLVTDMQGEINTFNPSCMVIAGNAQAELTDQERIKSFELFRNGLKDVQLVTYDELFRKIEILINLFEGKN